MAKKQKFYVVWKGRKTGVYANWEDCSAQVTGFIDAEYKSFDTLATAQKAYQNKYEDYKGKRTPAVSQLRMLGHDAPILESYCVDAACTGNPGPMEYRCVHTDTGKEIFKHGPYADGTNNIGEFLAIVQALILFKRKGVTLPVYSDSETAIGWVKRGKCNTKLDKNDAGLEIPGLIERAEKWLASNKYPNKILKWDTTAWGEIPADFGRK